MTNKRKSMRKVRQVLMLAWEAGLRKREIARSLSLSPTTVTEYLRRAEKAGLSWPLPEAQDDGQLEAMLFPSLPKGKQDKRPLPNWSEIHQEFKRKGVTLVLLWEEYKEAHPDGLQYSQFCDRYRVWNGKLDLVMRQNHKAGEKLFVDYAGQTVPVTDTATGEIRDAQIFVATLGASNYTYAEATWTQKLPDWIASHIRCFEFLGSVPALLVPDNLKSAVTKPCRYEPEANATYEDMADHYGAAILPARVRRPRDKAKVENGVLLVERWILARLRNHTFFSLSELNTAIRELLEGLKSKPFKKLPGCRKELFGKIDYPAMQSLPIERYIYAEWKKARVHIDYHVEVLGHYYSAPYALVQQELDVRITANTVELLHRNKRVASHLRSSLKGRHTTLTEHMPKAHQQYASWTPQRLVRWAEKTGPATAGLVNTILTHRKHPQQGFRSCLGIMRLGKTYGDDRLEAACRRAMKLGAISFKSVQSILKTGLDRQTLLAIDEEQETIEPIDHPNIRGAGYYH
ncbi:MAG: IS21 family transposase [Gammaproteobacteria bacterium]|nr:IS21 family transposase [Gammaproteobacteria bacterium]